MNLNLSFFQARRIWRRDFLLQISKLRSKTSSRNVGGAKKLMNGRHMIHRNGSRRGFRTIRKEETRTNAKTDARMPRLLPRGSESMSSETPVHIFMNGWHHWKL